MTDDYSSINAEAHALSQYNHLSREQLIRKLYDAETLNGVLTLRLRGVEAQLRTAQVSEEPRNRHNLYSSYDDGEM